MRKILKYSSMWAFFWFASYLFAQQFSSLTVLDTFTKYFQVALVGYMIYFVVYVALYVNGKLSDEKQMILERGVYLWMIGLTISYSVYIFGNPWLYGGEATLGSIVLEVQGVSLLLVLTAVTLIAGVNEKKTILQTQSSPLWNTEGAMDEAFLILIGISLVFLVLFNSKIIPGFRREYWQLLRTILVIIGLVSLWASTRLYYNHRVFYYTSIIGFTISTLWEAAIFIFYRKAVLVEVLSGVTTSLTVSTIIYIVLIFILCVWLCWVYKKEHAKRSNK